MESERVVPVTETVGPRARYDGLDFFRPLSIFGVVLIHYSQAFDLRAMPAFAAAIRVRDCAFPIIILTSFFVMTRSLMAHPGRTLAQFAFNRFVRLGVPCAVWSSAYWLMWQVAGPIWRGEAPAWPAPTLWLTGFVHLWFLQFLFLGALLAFPMIRLITRVTRLGGRPARIWAASACVAAAGVYWMWGRPFLASTAAFVWSDEVDLSLRVGVGQSIRYAEYTVLGIGLGLAADVIASWYRRPAFGAAMLLAAAAGCLIHLAGVLPSVSRATYSLAVFLVLLRPSFGGGWEWLRPAARYSYPIYILHPAVAQAALALPLWLATGSTLASLLAGSVAVFAASGAVAWILRILVPADWFLPLVPVGKGRLGAEVR